MQTLPKKLHEFSFFEREQKNGRPVANKCGRDFLYYTLNYHFPETFNTAVCNSTIIEHKRLFGYPVPAWLAWTQIQLATAPAFLERQGLTLYINDRRIFSYFAFVSAILFSRKTYQDAIREIEMCVNDGVPCGVDLSIGWFGLLDHVLFVYGYDEDNLYVIDTHRVPRLEYEQIGDERHYFKLPKAVMAKRWTRFGRVWRVVLKDGRPVGV